MKKLAMLGMAAVMAAPVTNAAQESFSFARQAARATFIYGDNLVTDVIPESDFDRLESAKTERQVQKRAAGLSAVMVTPSGAQYTNPRWLLETSRLSRLRSRVWKPWGASRQPEPPRQRSPRARQRSSNSGSSSRTTSLAMTSENR